MTTPPRPGSSTLVETGMQYYWSGGDVKKAEAEVFKGITLHGRYDVVEQAFAEASTLAPERLDFRYAVASTQIIQKKIPEAEATYQEITRHDPRATDAYAWLAALARVRGDADATALADIALAGLDRPWPSGTAPASPAPRRSWPTRRPPRSRRCRASR